MIAARHARMSLAALAVAVGLAACGGSSGGGGSGLASRSAAAIVRATTKASESAKSVHVAGSLNQGGTVIALDLKMVAGVGATGWMSDAGKRFSLVLDHSTLYIGAGPAFWQAFGNAAVAKLLRGKWLKTPATGDYASIAKFANLREFFQQIFSATTGHLSKASSKTINGHPAIGVRDTKKDGILYVATSGTPYPVEIDGTTAGKSSRTTGKLDFTDFNASVRISPPKNTISSAQLQKQG